jgi:hypothetical protein
LIDDLAVRLSGDGEMRRGRQFKKLPAEKQALVSRACLLLTSQPIACARTRRQASSLATFLREESPQAMQ